MLSSKLRADYIEMINNVLDRIQVDNLNDIQTAIMDLQNLVTPVQGFAYSEKYRETMDFIADYFDNPESYVQHREHDEEFRQIIRDRIAAKIVEFNTLTESQKAQYIEAQQEIRASAARTQREMASKTAPAPGSAGHVLTEHQWLAQIQQHMMNESIQQLEMILLTFIQANIHIPPHALNILNNLQALNVPFRIIPPNIESAIHDGLITLGQYFQIPLIDRPSLQHLFSPDGRAALRDGIITIPQYLQIPRNTRDSMSYFFSPDGRAAIADGLITLEHFLQLHPFTRERLQTAYIPNIRAAIANDIITLQQYLQIPEHARLSMNDLFTTDGRAAVRDGIITLEQYLEIPYIDRPSMQFLFSPDGRAAVRDGIITLQQYLQIPREARLSVNYLFSSNGRMAVRDGLITLEQYLEIPIDEREEALENIRHSSSSHIYP